MKPIVILFVILGAIALPAYSAHCAAGNWGYAADAMAQCCCFLVFGLCRNPAVR
jgi:hypothetical protein